VITEKARVPANEHYEYGVNQALLIWLAQKSTEKNEGKGDTLVTEAEPAGAHVLIFEKTVAATK